MLETQVMLESIPLSHGEFKLATRRVTNACRFVHSGEIGPAKYELQMLLGMLDELGSLIRRRQLVKPPLPPKTRLNESWSVAFSG